MERDTHFDIVNFEETLKHRAQTGSVEDVISLAVEYIQTEIEIGNLKEVE